jgi:hypothetical protein
MNADKRRLKTSNLSAFICVYQRPLCAFFSSLPGGIAVRFLKGAAGAVRVTVHKGGAYEFAFE